jgi:hypothetical protein
MNEGLPPPDNRAIGWYRFMLWMMPTCVAITSAFGIGWLANLLRLRGGELLILVWFVFNIAAAIGVGIFEVKLESPRWRRSDGRLKPSRVLYFVLLQFIIVPVMSCVIAFGFCLVAGA